MHVFNTIIEYKKCHICGDKESIQYPIEAKRKKSRKKEIKELTGISIIKLLNTQNTKWKHLENTWKIFHFWFGEGLIYIGCPVIFVITFSGFIWQERKWIPQLLHKSENENERSKRRKVRIRKRCKIKTLGLIYRKNKHKNNINHQKDYSLNFIIFHSPFRRHKPCQSLWRTQVSHQSSQDSFPWWAGPRG